MTAASILIVEDEGIVALDLKLQLQELGYAVVGIAASGAEAIAAATKHAPQLILMDVRLQGPIDGIATAEAIRQRQDTPLIFLTSHSDDETVSRAARTAPYGYLTKPYQVRELRAGIEVALTKARMERQLREADRWFAQTLRCVADGIVVTDVDARVRFLNPAAEQLTGWELEEALGKSVGDVVRLHGADGARGTAGAERLVFDVLRDGRPAPVSHGMPLAARDGAHRFVDETAGPVDDDRGSRLGAVVVLRDAALRMAQEVQLRASEARFRSAFDFAPLGMALVAFGGEMMQVNDALCRLLGRERAELTGANQLAFTLDGDGEHETARLNELSAAPGGVVQFEKRYRAPAGGAPIWVLVSVSMLHEGGQAACYLYQVHDLREQKQAAEHLAALADERMRREASELASAAKSEFLSRVSHEMRTPLNAVIGFAQLLQMQKSALDPVRVGTYADQIHAAGEHLLGLVSDLLDINRAAQGTLRLESKPVALSQVVDEALSLLRGQAASHGIAITCSVSADLVVMGDEQRLRQVILNIGSNAIKYNREGGAVTLHAERAPPGCVSLVIEDGGIGMTAQQLDRMFQPFDRLGAEQTKVPGTGLGLVITRSLVTDMGGTLGVKSTPRRGTAVTVTLRSAEPPPAV